MIRCKRLSAMLAMAAGIFFAGSPAITQAQNIRIGQTAGITGAAAATVKESMQGAALYFNQVNAQGGIAGRKIELITLDDKFDPALTLENAYVLIEEKKVVALFMPSGTPNTQLLVPTLDKFSIPLVGPTTGAMVLHRPVATNLFHVRAPYQREVEMAIGHLVRQGSTRIGVLYVDDTSGDDGLAGAMKGFKQNQIEPLFLETFDRNKPDFSASAPRILAKQPQAVIVIGSGSPAVEAILALRKTGYGSHIITQTNNASAGFIKALGDKARGIIVTQVFPSERSTGKPLIQALQLSARTQGITSISPAMVEGYASAKVLVEGLRRAAPNIDRTSLHDALESIRQYDLGGMELHYSSTNHSGLEYTELSIIGPDGRFQR